MPARTISLTLYGQAVTGLGFSTGEDVLFDVYCQDPLTRLPLPLAGTTLSLTLWLLDINGNPQTALTVVPGSVALPPGTDGHAQLQLAATQSAGLPVGRLGLTFNCTDTNGKSLLLCPLVPVVTTAGVATTLGGTPAAPSTSTPATASGFQTFSVTGPSVITVQLPQRYANNTYKVNLGQPRIDDPLFGFVSLSYAIIDAGSFSITASAPFPGGVPWSTAP